MPMRNEPCGWVPDFTGCQSGPCCPDIDEQTPEAIAVKALASKLAANILWALTGRRFGCCEITVRPCKPETCKPLTLADIIYWDSARGAGPGFGNNMGVLSYFPTLVGGEVFNIACGCPIGCCKCKADCEILLPGPICEIIDVQVDGQHLGKNQYTEYNHDRIVFANVGQQVVLQTDTVPLPAGIVQDTAFTLTPANQGVQLVDIGSNYQFSMTPTHRDFQFVIEIPVGSISTSFQIFQPQGFDVLVVDGGNPSLTVVGSTITVGAATIPDTTVKLLIRAPKNATINSLAIQQNTGNFGIVLDELQWTEYGEGEGYCPPCQNYNLPLGALGTWGITYTIGEPVPAELLWAAGQFACELAKAMLGDKSCTLPTRVQNVARQGIDIVFFDPTEFANAGLTGIPLVDLIIRSLNPYRMAQASYVWSPDLPKIRRET